MAAHFCRRLVDICAQIIRTGTCVCTSALSVCHALYTLMEVLTEVASPATSWAETQRCRVLVANEEEQRTRHTFQRRHYETRFIMVQTLVLCESEDAILKRYSDGCKSVSHRCTYSYDDGGFQLSSYIRSYPCYSRVTSKA